MHAYLSKAANSWNGILTWHVLTVHLKISHSCSESWIQTETMEISPPVIS